MTGVGLPDGDGGDMCAVICVRGWLRPGGRFYTGCFEEAFFFDSVSQSFFSTPILECAVLDGIVCIPSPNGGFSFVFLFFSVLVARSVPRTYIISF